MSTAVGFSHRTSNHFAHVRTEKHLNTVALSCIPVAGVCIAVSREILLANKIRNTTDAPKLIELIREKNDVKLGSVIRAMLSVVLMVAAIALGIVGGTLGAVLALAHFGVAGLHIREWSLNQRVIAELQTTGFRLGMLVK